MTPTIAPAGVRDDGLDDYGRPKWIIAGQAADGLELELVAVLDIDDAGELTVFITLHWEGRKP